VVSGLTYDNKRRTNIQLTKTAHWQQQHQHPPTPLRHRTKKGITWRRPTAPQNVRDNKNSSSCDESKPVEAQSVTTTSMVSQSSVVYLGLVSWIRVLLATWPVAESKELDENCREHDNGNDNRNHNREANAPVFASSLDKHPSTNESTEPKADDEVEEWMLEYCGAVLAPSSLNLLDDATNSGWGVFSLKDKARGTPVLGGDIVVQVHDLSAQAALSLSLLLQSYWWESEETGGFYEGQYVVSHMPGLGMLANSLQKGHNVLPFVPRIDEGGLTRLQSPGAGAITHYYNYTWFVFQPLQAGDEIFPNYGGDWFQERSDNRSGDSKLISEIPKIDTGAIGNDSQPTSFEEEDRPGHRSVDYLRRQGRCLDALVSRKSRIPHAGRGAFIRWGVGKGKIIAPVPVIPASKEALKVYRSKQSSKGAGSEILEGYQLLMNYVYGHVNSSTVLVPYGPIVSLINHGPSSTVASRMMNVTANVRLQWPQSNTLMPDTARAWLRRKNTHELYTQTQSAGLLLELVATRDIDAGEELFLDYGEHWQRAWLSHVESWSPPPNSDKYAPSYVHDDAILQARTEKELQQHPYPDHIFTSCFYPVHNATELLQQEQPKGTNQQESPDSVTTIKWRSSRSMFEYKNLRPCRVLERHPVAKMKNQYMYSVQILNRYGLRPHQRLPSTKPFIVTHVPRKAIRMSDKIYTTDQHLPGAFRHPIGLPDGVFPLEWQDVS